MEEIDLFKWNNNTVSEQDQKILEELYNNRNNTNYRFQHTHISNFCFIFYRYYFGLHETYEILNV